ncbi:MAG: type III pantothenate kinase [Balneolaceae bacterium]
MIFVEIGNSSVKAVRGTGSVEETLFTVAVNRKDQLEKSIQQLPDDERVLLSSVRKDLSAIILEEQGRLHIYEIKTKNLGKITLEYDTPDTLGIDRVLACAGAVFNSGTDAVVIDAGTACTVDWMTQNYRFRGGVIMPGLPMLRHGMTELTPELPGVGFEMPDEFPGKSTKDAIRIGLNSGFLRAIGSFVEQYQRIAGQSKLYITGGNGLFVKQHLEPQFNCRYRRNLVFDGMNAFLKLNKPQF